MAAAIGLAMGIGAAYLGVLEVALLTLIAPLLGFDTSTGFGSDVTGGAVRRDRRAAVRHARPADHDPVRSRLGVRRSGARAAGGPAPALAS